MRTTNEGRFPAARVAASPAGGPDGATIAAVALPGGSEADNRAGSIAARVAAASAARVEPGMVEVARRPGAAPKVIGLSDEGRVQALPVTLTVSHRHGRAVAAAHPATIAMGIDLESLGSVPAGLERLFLGPAEMPLLSRFDATTLWTLKEAAWKALGLGSDQTFGSLVLQFDVHGELCGLRHPGGETAARAAVWKPWTRFVTALVWLP